MLPLEMRTTGTILQRSVVKAPDAPFLCFGRTIYSYSDAHDEVSRIAGSLSASGVGSGSHVALMLKNSPEYVWSLLALGQLGAIAIPLNTEAKGKLLRYYLYDSDARFLIVDADLAGTIYEVLPEHRDMLSVTWTVGDRDGGPRVGSTVLAFGSDDTEGCGSIIGGGSARYLDPYLLLYTSGTTGPSKGVVMSHAQAVTTGALVAERFGLDASDRMYTCLPLFHVNAICYTTLAAIYCGASIALAERFSASRFWDDVVRYRATELNAMGSMFSLLEKQPPSAAERENSVRVAFVVPFPADPWQFERRYGAKLTTTYALSEWQPVAVTAPGEGYDKSGISAGTMGGPVLDHTEVRIVDAEDRELATGDVGEITLRSNEPWVTMREYYGKPEATMEAFRNLWFHTGDLGHVDGDGFLYFHGRKKDAIRRRGENISAQELEGILRDHPEIREVAAVGVRAEVGEEDVAVYVVLRRSSRLNEDGIFEYARRELPRYMVPRYIKIVDALPKTATSKIEKYKLVDEATRQLPDLWDADSGGTT